MLARARGRILARARARLRLRALARACARAFAPTVAGACRDMTSLGPSSFRDHVVGVITQSPSQMPSWWQLYFSFNLPLPIVGGRLVLRAVNTSIPPPLLTHTASQITSTAHLPLLAFLTLLLPDTSYHYSCTAATCTTATTASATSTCTTTTIDTSSITATATSTRTSTVTATATATTSLLLYSTPPCRHERKY